MQSFDWVFGVGFLSAAQANIQFRRAMKVDALAVYLDRVAVDDGGLAGGVGKYSGAEQGNAQ